MLDQDTHRSQDIIAQSPLETSQFDLGGIDDFVAVMQLNAISSGSLEVGLYSWIEAVPHLERMLNKYHELKQTGHPSIVVDSVFMVDTENAVKAFQREENISVDGIIGDETYNLLQQRLDELKGLDVIMV